MWANLAVGLLARPWARRATAIAFVALAIAMRYARLFRIPGRFATDESASSRE